MTALNDIAARITDLEYQVIECRNSGDHEFIPQIRAEIEKMEAAYMELKAKAPDYNQIPF